MGTNCHFFYLVAIVVATEAYSPRAQSMPNNNSYSIQNNKGASAQTKLKSKSKGRTTFNDAFAVADNGSTSPKGPSAEPDADGGYLNVFAHEPIQSRALSVSKKISDEAAKDRCLRCHAMVVFCVCDADRSRRKKVQQRTRSKGQVGTSTVDGNFTADTNDRGAAGYYDADDHGAADTTVYARPKPLYETSAPLNLDGDYAEEVLSPSNRSNTFRALGIFPGQIKLEGKIGEGKYGVVHAGRLEPSSSASALRGSTRTVRVAIKMLKTHELKSDPAVAATALAELEREAILTASMSHSNVVRVLGVCFAETQQMMVILEFCGQGSLEGLLHAFAAGNESDDGLISFGVPRAASYLADVASGMVHLAELRCVHRDLAARNVLITDANVAKIADFGLGRQIDAKDEVYKMMTSRPLPVAWMAPEDLETNSGSAGGDIWAFGVLAWEVASLGRRPYDDLEPGTLVPFVIGGGRLASPAGCPLWLFKAMQSCWSVDYRERPSFKKLRSLMKRHAVRPVTEELDPVYAAREAYSSILDPVGTDDGIYNTVISGDGVRRKENYGCTYDVLTSSEIENRSKIVLVRGTAVLVDEAMYTDMKVAQLTKELGKDMCNEFKEASEAPDAIYAAQRELYGAFVTADVGCVSPFLPHCSASKSFTHKSAHFYRNKLLFVAGTLH